MVFGRHWIKEFAPTYRALTPDASARWDFGPGKIWKGKQEVIASHEKALADRNRSGWTIVTIPTWIIVDRGRITCRFERFASRKLFSARIDVDSAVGPTQKKVILVTMDLNDSNKIQRMEYRLLCKEHDVAGIPNWDWDETVHSIKTKPVVINYNI
ncbi:hypothetical protein CGCF415_v010603 [Colletotrichum fructicola]|nr:hypothetical protein CGCF415_v010603 [Colletotrichum fructicola]KAF4932334.1 hypothetical protein CGCF245_v010650 [Colletotrichum fructicola]